MPRELQLWFRAIGIPLSDCYGMSESTGPITWSPFATKPGTVGKPLPGTEVKLAEDGEIICRGPNVFGGYYKDPERTAEALDAEGWLHSGDLAVRLSNGYYRITGRIKDMVIRGGENIYPREVEEFLYGHPKVGDVQVIGVPDVKYGEELCAWIRLRDGETATAEELRDYCRGQIAGYKIPRYIRFSTEFPMTVTGKIQKFRMREISIVELGLEHAATIRSA